MNFSKNNVCKSFLLITLFSISVGQVFSEETVKTEKQKLPQEQCDKIVKMLTNVGVSNSITSIEREEISAGSFKSATTLGALTSLIISSFFIKDFAEKIIFKDNGYVDRLDTLIDGLGKSFLIFFVSALLSYAIFETSFDDIVEAKNKLESSVIILETFLARWEELRSNASDELKEFLEPIYAKYLANNCKLNLTKEEARKIIEDAVKICLTQKVQV